MSRYTTVTDSDRAAMLEAIGVASVDELFAEIPQAVRLGRPLELPAGLGEAEVYEHLRALAARNTLDRGDALLPGRRDVRHTTSRRSSTCCSGARSS